jgi:hypothetical protein
MAWLSDWEKRIKCVIDQTKIDTANQLNLPVLAYLSASSGITSADKTCFFDELDYPSVDDDFTGSNGSAPDTDKWSELDPDNIADIQSNKLNVAASGANDKYCLFSGKWNLSGDFDIQVDFDVTSLDDPVSSMHYACTLRVEVGAINCRFGRARAGGGDDGYYLSGSSDAWADHPNADTIGKLRIKRVGGTFTSYYWHNSQWEWDGSTAGYIWTTSTTEDVVIRLYSKQESGSSLDVNYDNFTVNSGTVVWPQGYHPNRKKIAITTSDGTTQCYVEVERWDDANEKAWLWVKVPSVAYNADTDLYLYYDADQSNNTTYVGDIGSTPAQAVWGNSFVGVWHMCQDPSGGSGCIKDSTSNGNDGTPVGSMTSGDLVDGKTGKGIQFDGSDDCIDLLNQSQIIPENADFTIESTSSVISGVMFGGGGNSGDYLWSAKLLKTTYEFVVGGVQVTVDIVDANTVWHDFVCVRDGDNFKGYVDGAYDTVDTQAGGLRGSTSSFVDRMLIGGVWVSGAPTITLEGTSSEVRVSSVIRSAPWIKATHHSNFDSLITFGSEETIIAWAFDGKLRIKDTKDDLFDGKLEVAAGIKISLFDGKLRIKDTGDNLFDGKLRIKDTKDDLFDGRLRVKDTATWNFDGKLWIALVSRLQLLGGFGEPGKLDIQEPLGVSGVRKILLGLGDALEYLLHIPMAEGNQQLVINRLSDYISAIQMVINELSVGDPSSGKQSVFTSLQSDAGAVVLRNELSGIVAGIQSLITALTDGVSSHVSLINELALKDDIHSLLVLLGSMPDPAVLYPDCTLNVYLDGVPIKPKQITSLSFTMDRGVTFDVLSINSTDMRLYASLQMIVGNEDSVIEVQYQGTSWMFLIEEVSGFELSFSVWGRSIAAAKSDAPFKDSANFVLGEDTVASVVAEDLVPELPVTWNAVDWTILADWSVDGTPVQMLKTLADSIGAVVRSYPDGTGFYVDEKYTTRPVNLPYAASEADFDRDVNLISLDASRDLGTGANAVTVHGHSPLSKYSVRLEAESCVEVGSPAVIKVYPALNGSGYSLIASDGAPTYQHSLAEERTEIVNFVGGKGSVSYPITALMSITWDGAAPAGFEYTAGQDEIVLTDDTPAAVGEVVYLTRYDVWHGAHSGEGQLLVVCYLDESGGIVARVYFDEGDREADDIDKPILTSIEAAVAAGQAFLDDTSYNRLLRSITAPCSDVSDGDVVCVSSDLSGVTGNTIVLRHEVSAQVDGEALKISSNLEVVQFEV